MRKSILKTFLLFVVAALVFFVSCGETKAKTYKVTYELNGGTISGEYVQEYDGTKTVSLPAAANVTKSGATFDGWFESADFSGAAVTYIKKDSTGDKTFYAKWTEGGSSEGGGESSTEYKPKDTLNKKGYNLGGITVYVQVNPLTSYDATSSDYTGERKADHITHMALLNKAYNVKLTYHEWEAEWGPARIAYIRNNYLDGSFFKDTSSLTYIVSISSQWIPSLVKSNCLAALYNINTEEGIFTDFGYTQDDTNNQSNAVKGIVYGYTYGTARPDYFMYYNIDLVAECGLEDPAELWFKGEWTWSKFVSWAKEGQTVVSSKVDGGYAIDMSYAASCVGFVAAQGQYMINPSTHKVAFTNSSTTKLVDAMLQLIADGLWDPGHGVQDCSVNFCAGKTLIHDGSIWYLKDTSRFAQNDSTVKVGVVPYPMADGETVSVYTEPYTYLDTQGNKVTVTEPLVGRDGNTLTKDGQPVYGIDLSQVENYRIPYTGSTAYSILDKSQIGQYGIDQTVAFSLLYDLDANFGDDPTIVAQTNDEGYRTTITKKLDEELDVEVIMSVQHDSLTYFDLMMLASMTTGDGSHFGEYGFYPVMASLASNKTTSCLAKFTEIKPAYEEALKVCGY